MSDESFNRIIEGSKLYVTIFGTISIVVAVFWFGSLLLPNKLASDAFGGTAETLHEERTEYKSVIPWFSR